MADIQIIKLTTSGPQGPAGTTAAVDTDATMAANSDALVASQKATKTADALRTVGPASSVLDRIAAYADTTGKLLKDGGLRIADLVQLAGAQVITGLKSVSLGTAVTAQEYWRWSPTDTGVGKPYLYLNKSATANRWDFGLWDGVNALGQVNWSVGTFTLNGVAIADISSAQSFSNKTYAGGTLSGTFAGARTRTGLDTYQLGTATTFATYLSFAPTDVGVGKPSFNLQKSATANQWNITLFDGVNAAGTIDVTAGTFSWGGSPIMTRGAAETITGLKTVTISTATTASNYLSFKPTDYNTGKPQFYINKLAGAASWEVGLFDNTDTTGIINFAVSNLNHNALPVAVTNYTLYSSDADITLAATARSVLHNGTLTAARTITLPAAGPVGQTIRVTRTGAGGFNLNVGVAKILTTNTWCEVTSSGAGWYLSAYGAL